VVTKRLEFQDLIKEDGKSFRLNTKVYKDEEIFRVEQEIFFHNSWTFLAHESQVEYPNDYMTTYIGRYPVILVRDERGKLRCFMNRCRHRGSLVCRAKSGNSRSSGVSTMVGPTVTRANWWESLTGRAIRRLRPGLHGSDRGFQARDV